MSKEIRKLAWTNFFGHGPKILPYVKTVHQKNMGLSNPRVIAFKPSEYESDSPEARKKMAFEDAKNHRSFYDDLIKKGVYPQGTKVKVKRMRHSDAYTLEMVTPHEWTVDKYLRKYPEETGTIRKEIKDTASLIRQVARKHGYNFVNAEVTTEGVVMGDEFNEDIRGARNYAVDYFNDRGVSYIDVHVLNRRLPFEGRKKTADELEAERRTKEARKHGPLDHIIESIIVGSFILSLFFMSSNLTGYAISDLDVKSSSFIGVILFLVALISSLIHFRKRN